MRWRWAGSALAVYLLFCSVTFVTGWGVASRLFLDQLAMQTRAAVNSVAELRKFHDVIKQDVQEHVSGEQLFGVLQGKNLLVMFVESYGGVLIGLG